MKRLLIALVLLVMSSFAIAAVNINTATKEELDALPGIGSVKAQAIIDYRNANGPFKTPADIMKVKGIKEGEFAKIKDQIAVSGATTTMAAPAKAAEAPKTPAAKTTPSSAPAKAGEPAKAPAAATASAPAPMPAKEESKAMKAADDKAAKDKAKAEKAEKTKAAKEEKARKAAEEKTSTDKSKADKSKGAADAQATKDKGTKDKAAVEPSKEKTTK